jgi:hypothetical protein
VKCLDIISWIQEWFLQNCDDDWEHGEGIKIETVDNPGWYVEINLIGTTLEDKQFTSVEVERDEFDWYYCIIKDGAFHGSGGVKNLEEILKYFKQWAVE